jgi:hypothetical protein
MSNFHHPYVGPPVLVVLLANLWKWNRKKIQLTGSKKKKKKIHLTAPYTFGSWNHRWCWIRYRIDSPVSIYSYFLFSTHERRIKKRVEERRD